jgi:localization factor PodJL
MPSSDKIKTQPVVRQPGPGKTSSQSCAAAGLDEALHRIASQIGDADRRHCDALNDMQERLGQFGRQVDQVRAGLPEQHAGALTRIEQEIAALAERIAAFGRERLSPRDASGAAQPEVPAVADEPWDAQSAEALTRVYEMAQADLQSARPQSRTTRPGKRRAMQAEAPAPQASAPAYDQAWLEARFAGIAALLQQSLADSNPAKPLAALDRRLEQLEGRLDTLLGNVSAHFGGEWLNLVEAHIKELTVHFEATGRQLARLDAIDEQLRQLSRELEDHRQWSRAQPAGLRDDAIAALIDTAAERAASRLAAAMPAAAPAPEADSGKRIEALEGLMQDYIAERRRGEEATSGTLHTIEEALIRIMDRVDAMEAAGSAPYRDGDAVHADGVEVENERLAQAYASGVRVLGQKPSAPTLDAADYAPPPPRQEARQEEGDREPAARGIADAAAAEEAQARQELRASVMRAKLKAQATPEEPTPASSDSDAAKAGAGQRERAKTSVRAGGLRSSLLLGGAMALLFGASYLVVDVFLMRGPAGVVQQRSVAPAPQAQPAADLGQPKAQGGIANPQPGPQPGPQTGKSGLAPPAGEKRVGPVPVPQPARRHMRETATDDLTHSQGQAAPRPAGRPVPGNAIATGAIAEPAAVSPQTLPGMVLQEDPLTARDGAAPPGIDAAPPASVGNAALRNAAAKGDVFAQFEVATRFAEGNGVAQDHKQAFAWYERAAMRGLASAQFRLGAYYERGLGVAADAERAKIWYRRAAEQGHVRAMHNLAVLIIGSGEGQTDYAAAVRWFRHAADRGFTDSQFNLAMLYAHGRGIARDLTESYKWFGLAARAGDAGAARRLEEIKAQLELPEREAAEQKLTAWRADTAAPAANHAGR